MQSVRSEQLVNATCVGQWYVDRSETLENAGFGWECYVGTKLCIALSPKWQANEIIQHDC
jgi:hypothetical protein